MMLLQWLILPGFVGLILWEVHGRTLNLFQWLTLPFIVALLLWEVIGRRRRTASPGFWLIRCFVCCAAGAAIADPLIVQRVADAIGIGRGTDAVLYLFVLLFLAASFYFYWQKVVLQRQITLLVRHIAIQEARRSDDSRPTASPASVSESS